MRSSVETERTSRVAIGLALLFLLPGSLAAADEQDAAALAKTIQNPIATLVTVPFQANFNRGVGPYDRQLFNLNIQPVVPFSAGRHGNVVTRTIIPLNGVPVGETGSEFGFGDIQFSAFWVPDRAGKRLTWGVGPQINLPTASNPEVLGSNQLSMGPTAVVFYGIGAWTMGAVVSNVWSVAGDSERDDVDFFYAQWFLNYNLGKGWAIGTAPILTCDRSDDSTGGDSCTVPWGLQVSKLFKVNRRPINLLAGYYDNARTPEGGADHQVRLQVNFLFPPAPAR